MGPYFFRPSLSSKASFRICHEDLAAFDNNKTNKKKKKKKINETAN